MGDELCSFCSSASIALYSSAAVPVIQAPRGIRLILLFISALLAAGNDTPSISTGTNCVSKGTTAGLVELLKSNIAGHHFLDFSGSFDPDALYITSPPLFICCNNGKCFSVADLLTTNSPGVSIAGTVSVPFGLKSIYFPVLA